MFHSTSRSPLVHKAFILQAAAANTCRTLDSPSEMLLQPHNPPLPYASPLRSSGPAFATLRVPIAFRRKTLPAITCSISPPVPNYVATDFKRKPVVKWYWKNVYKKISSMENGTAAELDQFEENGVLNKWKLRMVVKELRKYRLYKQALEVHEWMISKGERFRLSLTDVAIQLDLISRVHGISSAEDFFTQTHSNDKAIHMSLLNTYARSKMIDKAESFMSTMRKNGYAKDAPPFNVMMTLYKNLKEYDKVEALVSEMMHSNIKLDECSYNIWLLSHGSQGSLSSMEEVYEQMKLDSNIKPGWNTLCTMCSIYIQMGLMEKAEESLKSAESLITVRDWIPYHSLISLYAGIGKKDEIYRLWSTYTSIFPAIPSLGYRTVISALTRVGDIEGAENMYKQWQSAAASRDPKVGNLLINWYVKKGVMEKAESVFDRMVEVGAKPNSSTWEILAEGYIAERRIKEALSCYEEAASIDGSSWRPSPRNVSALMDLCKEEGEYESKATLLELLGRSKFIKDGLYASRVGFSSSNNGGLVGNDDESSRKSEEYQQYLSSNIL